MSKKLHCYYCGKFLAIIEEGKISPKLVPVCEDCNYRMIIKIREKKKEEDFWKDYWNQSIFGKY